MHKSSGIELSHSCIDNREPSFSILPSLKMFVVVLPLEVVKFGLKGQVWGLEYSGEVVGDVDVEISPM